LGRIVARIGDRLVDGPPPGMFIETCAQQDCTSRRGRLVACQKARHVPEIIRGAEEQLALVVIGERDLQVDVVVVARRLGITYPQVALFRSEEHTSELQSRENLVCRLLLEKKKNRQNIRNTMIKVNYR